MNYENKKQIMEKGATKKKKVNDYTAIFFKVYYLDCQK